jgi:hypothetical protein
MAKNEGKPADIIPVEQIAQVIILVRGEKVMLDADLATLYGVETRALIQAVNPKVGTSQLAAGFVSKLAPTG